MSSLILDLPISSNKINLIFFSLNFLSFLTKLIKIFLLLISSFGNSNFDINRVAMSYSSFDKLPNLFERYPFILYSLSIIIGLIIGLRILIFIINFIIGIIAWIFKKKSK